MPTITQGGSAAGTTGYLDSVTVQAGSGFAQFESPTGTVLAQFSGSRTFGPYTNQTYTIRSIIGTLYYEALDNFPTGSTVSTSAVMGSVGIAGLANPDGSLAAISGVAATQYANLIDRATVNLPLINAPLATALSNLQPALVTSGAGQNLKTINNASPLGTGDIALQTPLVSGASLKTINSGSLLGSGDIAVQPVLSSGSNIKTINGASVLGSGDLTVSATGSETLVTHTDAIPLDTKGFGKAANAIVGLTANRTLSLGASPVAGGAYEFVGQQNATGGWSIAVPGTWIQRGSDTMPTAPGGTAKYVFEYQSTGDVVFVIVPLSGVDVTPPTLSTAIVSDTNALRIDLTWSEPIQSAIPAASAFTVSGSHTVTGHTYVDSTHTYLTISSPFVGGESQTLAYTQPGTNNLKDLAGNAAVNFSGYAITDNVVNPTLVSAVVANATPGRIDLTWSKSMSSTIPAASTFAVSAGHALTAHTYVDATHTYLTTSTNFVASETRTLSYTPSGTNDEQDTNGNKVAAFSGTSITDNVSSGGGFTETFTHGVSTFPSGWTAGTGWIIAGAGADYAIYDSSSGAGSSYAFAVHTGTSHTTVDVTCDINATQAVAYPTLAMCYTDAGNYIGLQVNQSTNTIHIQEVVAGATVLNYDTGVAIPSIGTYATYRLTLSAGSITAYMNGTQVGLSQTASGSNTGNSVGFGLNGADRAQFDNFILA